jgi:PAS domain S-box-containing protein
LYASASHSDVLGYEPKVLIGMELRRVIARDDIPHSDLSIQDAVLGGQTTEIGFRHRKADGSYVYMRRKTRGLKGDNASRYYVMTRSSLRSA